MGSQHSKSSVFRADNINVEAILASFEHFSGIYGASSANGRPTRSPAFRFSLWKAKLEKFKSSKWLKNDSDNDSAATKTSK